VVFLPFLAIVLNFFYFRVSLRIYVWGPRLQSCRFCSLCPLSHRSGKPASTHALARPLLAVRAGTNNNKIHRAIASDIGFAACNEMLYGALVRSPLTRERYAVVALQTAATTSWSADLVRRVLIRRHESWVRRMRPSRHPCHES
jgi:hypothetical protein